ncbi:MAG: rhodanese [Algoriphagus sp. 32-45-6]|nr:MAG: rhodanese [Algoriphagus sp. 32-45-6]
MTLIKEIDIQQLSNWLKTGKDITILDIRPLSERNEWYIPSSIYVDAYNNLKAGNSEALNDLQIDIQKPVVTLCAGGNLSRFAAKILAKKGFESYSLQGGMKAWNYAFDTAVMEFQNFKIIQIRRLAKGCLSYMIGSKNSAMVIDASLDPQIYDHIAKKEAWKIEFVTDTHIHADYVSRTKELAIFTKATHLMNSLADVAYPFDALSNNENIKIGDIKIKAIHTPGHTWESTTFAIGKHILLTGDTLFTDAIGRPDLKANEEEAKNKTIALYKSLQFIKTFDDETLIFPAHISKPIEFGQAIITETLGKIKVTIPVLSFTIEHFLERILSKLPPSPHNYLTIAEINRTGNLADFIIADLEAGANRCAIN